MNIFVNWSFKETILNIALSIISLSILLFFIELSLRTALYQYIFVRDYPKIHECQAPGDFLENKTLYKTDHRFGWTYYPNSQFFEKRSRTDNWHLHTYDESGFRNNYDSGRTGVLFLGDSFIRGRLASDRATVTYLLDRWMPGTFVKNYAVGGYSTIHELRVYQHFGNEIDHDLVILGFYYLDVLENARYYYQEKGKTEKRNWLSRWIERDEKLVKHLYIYRFLKKPYHRFQKYLKRDDPVNLGLSPFPQGDKRRRKIQFTIKILKKVITSVQRNEADLLILNIPPKVLVEKSSASKHYRSGIRDFLRSQLDAIHRLSNSSSVHVLNPLGQLRKLNSEGRKLYGREDSHLNEQGQRVLARLLYQWGVQHGYLAESHPNFKRRFTTDYPNTNCPSFLGQVN